MKQLLVSFFITIYTLACAQHADSVITVKEVERIEKILSSDSMQGRRAGSVGSYKAAQFIANEFKAAGLQPWKGTTSFLQTFRIVEVKSAEVKGRLDDLDVEGKSILVFSTKKELDVNEQSGFDTKTIPTGANLVREAYGIIQSGKKIIVFVPESYSNDFLRLRRLQQPTFASESSTVFILTDKTPKKFSIKAQLELEEQPLTNVVGILPGKSKPNEYVVFSGHYDHLGIGKDVNGDSIYNGANDDAAGITAVIMLANYFKQLHNNERTLVFASFTAEEIGGFGSQYFSQQFNPAQVIAMFNIEMIGTESKWGKNSAYITGYEKTDMGKIMQENLQGTPFTFHPDPYPQQQLFYRSDNATLARLGVPAHTISTSKMDSEKFYHTVDDEWETLDMNNMAAIIKAIAESSKSIVSGKATPGRVNTSELR